MHTVMRADGIRAQNPNGPVYLGFPGPSGNIGVQPSPSLWNTYWSDYASTITNYYNNINLHAYGSLLGKLQSLKDRCYGEATDVRTRFPAFPQRFSEYGLDIRGYPGGNTAQNHVLRGQDYASFVNWVRSGWNNDILACHVFIARTSPAFESSQVYELTDAEAAALANGVGCVGQ